MEPEIACNSPPCMLNEQFAGPALPALAADWGEVRLWRKAKRAVLIERRLAMAPAEREAGGAAITATLERALADHPGALVGAYWPFKGEYDPRPLMRALHAGGMRLALPVVVEKAMPMIFRPWWPGVSMVPGIWNIPVPAEGEPVFPDILLAPVVGFDGANYRLGYGGGYYDRTLAAMAERPRAIGVGFERSRIATVHPQPHDIPLDRIVTERG